MALPTTPDETITLLFNPSKDDFVCSYDGHPYTMPSRVISKFPRYLADHLAKHLASDLALREQNGRHFEDRYQDWRDKIYVTMD